MTPTRVGDRSAWLALAVAAFGLGLVTIGGIGDPTSQPEVASLRA
jgi:hypothetical protein